MSLPAKLKRFVTDGRYRWIILANKGFYDRLDDETYVKKQYYAYFGRELNLNAPKTYWSRSMWQI